MPAPFPSSVFASFPHLHTGRLHLTEIREEHRKDLFRIFGDPRVTRYYNIQTLTEEAEAQKFIDHFSNRYQAQAALRWGISLEGESRIIGTLGFNNFSPDHRANIGYDLAPDFWGNGYAAEAVEAALRFGFERLHINRAEAEVMPGNGSSEKLLARLGFEREGVLRQWMYWNDTHFDMTMFSLLRKDYRNRSGYIEKALEKE